MHRYRAFQVTSLFSAFLCAILLFSPQARAEDNIPRHASTVTLHLENDLFYDTDRQYTHGMKLSWVSPDLTENRDTPFVPRWGYPLIERLPLVSNPGYRRSVSFSFGQGMYTPEEIERRDLVVDDRPYAGITYLAVGVHGKDNGRMDTIEIEVGIVGPHSYVEDCQKVTHNWVAATEPQGWDHQLRDEPLLNLFVERKWRLLRTQYSRGFGSDFIPRIGGGAGNAFIGASGGGEARFGWHLPNDFGTSIIRSGSDGNTPLDGTDPRLSCPRRVGVHLFLAASGTAVAHNILLDGNTFRDSHSVEKEHLVASLIGGIGITAGRFKITYAHIYQTKEFKTQNKDQQYGSISVSYTF